MVEWFILHEYLEFAQRRGVNFPRATRTASARVALSMTGATERLGTSSTPPRSTKTSAVVLQHWSLQRWSTRMVASQAIPMNKQMRERRILKRSSQGLSAGFHYRKSTGRIISTASKTQWFRWCTLCMGTPTPARAGNINRTSTSRRLGSSRSNPRTASSGTMS